MRSRVLDPRQIRARATACWSPRRVDPLACVAWRAFAALACFCAVWLLVGAVAAASADADIRTGRGVVADPPPARSSPTHPVLRDAVVRYDSDAGRIDATVSLLGPLAVADSQAVSALAAWRVQVSFGDWLHDGFCSGWVGTWPQVTAALGDDMPGIYGDFFDESAENGVPIPVPVTKTYSADRSVVTLSVAHPRLRGLPLICADARVYDSRDQDTCSCTDGFLLDGFSALDGGAAARVTVHALEYQVAGLASGWSEFAFLFLDARCAVRGEPGELACRLARVRVDAIPGKPALTLSGTVSVSPERRRAWEWNMRGALTWRRCPNRASVPVRLRGRACRIRVRWTGTSGNLPGIGTGRDLAELVPKSRGLRDVRPA